VFVLITKGQLELVAVSLGDRLRETGNFRTIEYVQNFNARLTDADREGELVVKPVEQLHPDERLLDRQYTS
jgi:hypothetical protein